MHLNGLDLNLLVALDALLITRNVTRAAERLNLSQPTLSGALARLRDHFGDPLLVRMGRRMELTPRAELLQEAVRDILLRIDTSLSAQPQFDAASSTRCFTLLVSDYTLAVLMPHLLGLAAKQASGVRFDFRRLTGAEPALALERGEADLLFIPQQFASSDHPAEILFEEGLVCAVWQGSRHARGKLTRRTYEEAGHVDLHPTDVPAISVVGPLLQHLGMLRRVEVSSHSFLTLPALVVGTDRIATIHHRLAHAAMSAWPILLRPPPIALPPLTMVIQWHRLRALDPGLEWLRDLIRAAVASMPAMPDP